MKSYIAFTRLLLYKSCEMKANINFSFRCSAWSESLLQAFWCHWIHPRRRKVRLRCKIQPQQNIIIHLSAAAARSVQTIESIHFVTGNDLTYLL